MFRIRLKQLRENNNLSQRAFAEILGIAQSTVGMWESGKREPDFTTVQEIANYFNVSVDYLLGREERKPTLDEQLEGIEFALYGEVKELTDAQKQDILDYARFKKAQWEKENGNK